MSGAYISVGLTSLTWSYHILFPAHTSESNQAAAFFSSRVPPLSPTLFLFRVCFRPFNHSRPLSPTSPSHASPKIQHFFPEFPLFCLVCIYTEEKCVREREKKNKRIVEWCAVQPTITGGFVGPLFLFHFHPLSSFCSTSFSVRHNTSQAKLPSIHGFFLYYYNFSSFFFHVPWGSLQRGAKATVGSIRRWDSRSVEEDAGLVGDIRHARGGGAGLRRRRPFPPWAQGQDQLPSGAGGCRGPLPRPQRPHLRSSLASHSLRPPGPQRAPPRRRSQGHWLCRSSSAFALAFTFARGVHCDG